MMEDKIATTDDTDNTDAEQIMLDCAIRVIRVIRDTIRQNRLFQKTCHPQIAGR